MSNIPALGREGGQKGYIMDLREASDQIVLLTTQYGLSVLGALIILVVGYYLSKKVPLDRKSVV